MAANNLRRRDAILEAVAFAANRFLNAASWEQVVQEVLERIGNVTAVSRVYIFENNTNPLLARWWRVSAMNGWQKASRR